MSANTEMKPQFKTSARQRMSLCFMANKGGYTGGQHCKFDATNGLALSRFA